MPYQQRDEEIQKVVSSWLNDVIAGRRPGKEYLAGSNREHNEHNLTAIFEHAIRRHGLVAQSYLDESVRILIKSDALRGVEQKPFSRDISKGESHGSISLESAGDLRTVLSKVLGGIAGVHAKWDAQEAESKRAFVPLPRRELTQEEMFRATKEQLKDYCEWKNNADVRSGGSIR